MTKFKNYDNFLILEIAAADTAFSSKCSLAHNMKTQNFMTGSEGPAACTSGGSFPPLYAAEAKHVVQHQSCSYSFLPSSANGITIRAASRSHHWLRKALGKFRDSFKNKTNIQTPLTTFGHLVYDKSTM